MVCFQVLSSIKFDEHLKTSIKVGAPQLYKKDFLSIITPKLYALHVLQEIAARESTRKIPFFLFSMNFSAFHRVVGLFSRALLKNGSSTVS